MTNATNKILQNCYKDVNIWKKKQISKQKVLQMSPVVMLFILTKHECKAV